LAVDEVGKQHMHATASSQTTRECFPTPASRLSQHKKPIRPSIEVRGPGQWLWAYQTARCYAERYDSGYGTGLPPASIPLVQDIADFWMQEFGLTAGSIAMPATAEKPNAKKSSAKPGKQKVQFTHRQGQFLAFIHQYRKLHRRDRARWIWCNISA
jgi:hypothetical protein